MKEGMISLLLAGAGLLNSIKSDCAADLHRENPKQAELEEHILSARSGD